MNAYFAGAAKLGAALGPRRRAAAWFARGSSAGEVPRRSLAVVAGLSVLSLAVTAVAGLALPVGLLLTTGSFTLVYVLGTAAALSLLPRGSWSRRGAGVALVSSLFLAVSIGVPMLWALGAGRRSRCRRLLGSASLGVVGLWFVVVAPQCLPEGAVDCCV